MKKKVPEVHGIEMSLKQHTLLPLPLVRLPSVTTWQDPVLEDIIHFAHTTLGHILSKNISKKVEFRILI